MKLWLKLLLGVVAVLYLLAAGTGYYMEATGPPLDTEKWPSLKESGQEAVTAIIPPRPGESYLYFYSLGAFSYAEDGNLVTDQRVVSYFEGEDGEFYRYETDYRDIEDILVSYGSGFLEDTEILVVHADPELDYPLVFSVKGGLDRELVEYIQSRLKSPGGDT